MKTAICYQNGFFSRLNSSTLNEWETTLSKGKWVLPSAEHQAALKSAIDEEMTLRKMEPHRHLPTAPRDDPRC